MSSDIAIVGMSCRLPGARDLDEFWRNLAGGVESIARFAHDARPGYVNAAPVLEDPGGFDAAFFGYSPMEAKTMDPQHRLLLELAHEALEHSGHDPQRTPGRVGVFAASALNTYFLNAALHRRLAEEYIPTLIGNDKDFLATRVSYKLNLKGPSLTVQTACSSSLVAIHLARQSLLCEETDIALAGAVSVRVPHRAGYFYDAGGVVSPDGRVRAFDAAANGTVFGSGGGVLVLKRLSDALAEGDSIRAVIRGSAVNNDGAGKAGYTAPSVDSQADAVIEALANAGVAADSISYLEAHGSGTPVGDPIEVRALTKAFRAFTQRSGYCALGSVKTNVGHLDAAAGIAGVIKTVLALGQRQLPPSLHFTLPNPEIDFPGTPFYVNTELKPWTSDGPRRAGVMSTGMGGTNAHLVLEEAPPQPRSGEDRGPHLLLLSAKTATALDHATQRLADFVQKNPSVSMGDVAYTLRVGRKAFAHRRYLLNGKVHSGKADGARRPLVLLLPGVGDQYVGMGRELYQTHEVFRQEVDRCAQLLEPQLGCDIRGLLYPAEEKKTGGKGIDLRKMLARGDSGKLGQTLFAQPALFTIEYAMARLWQSLGVMPDAIAGHSMGEYVAACLAGVLSLEDALRLIATRARLVAALPRGAMLAVPLPERELAALLPGELSIALINGPSLCVVAGAAEAVAAFENTLQQKGILARRVQNAHAFHSRMLEPIVAAFEREVAKVRLAEPKIPYTSNVSGTWITPAQATSPAYWAQHATRTARFSDALGALGRLGNPVLLEAGPGRTLSVLAAPMTTVHSLRHDYENESDLEVLRHAAGKLWLCGIETKGSGGRRVALPTYPFERQQYWIEPQDAEPPSGFENWFYVPTWDRTPLPRAAPPKDVLWLGAADDYLKLLGERKRAAPSAIHIVHRGDFHSLLRLAQAIGELDLTIPIRIAVVTSGVHEVTGEERLQPENATLLGPCGVMPKEYPNVECFNIDLPGEELPDAILAEFASAKSGAVIAYRGKYRWERRYQQVRLPPLASRLKRGGVYLITGGTGGIGLALAKHFAPICQPTLILTKKTPLTDKTTRALLEIEKAGARVEVVVADVSDRAQMQQVFEKYGPFDGVIHAAGIVRAGLMQVKTRETADRVLAPKVRGTRILFELLKKANPDFLVLFSSMTAVTTPHAECDYSAANAFLDAFSGFANAQAPFHTLTINWPGWREAGMLAELEMPAGMEAWKQSQLDKAIATRDGVEAFERALGSGLKQVVVSPENLERALAASHEPVYFARAKGQREMVPESSNTVEAGLAGIWASVFGLPRIDAAERFSDLGGHSLLAMQIVAKVRSLYGIDFTLKEFFDAPTVAQASSLIEARIVAEIERQ